MESNIEIMDAYVNRNDEEIIKHTIYLKNEINKLISKERNCLTHDWKKN